MIQFLIVFIQGTAVALAMLLSILIIFWAAARYGIFAVMVIAPVIGFWIAFSHLGNAK